MADFGSHHFEFVEPDEMQSILNALSRGGKETDELAIAALTWVDKTRCALAMLENINAGEIDIKGVDANGSLLFELNQRGMESAQKLIEESPEAAAMIRALNEGAAADKKAIKH